MNGERGNNINRSIARKRHLVGLTQHKLAEASGIAVQRITTFETGRLVLEDQELDRIRVVLKKRALKAMDAVGA